MRKSLSDNKLVCEHWSTRQAQNGINPFWEGENHDMHLEKDGIMNSLITLI